MLAPSRARGQAAPAISTAPFNFALEQGKVWGY